MHSNKTAFEILAGIQEIEKNFGRIQKTGSEYEARTMDIDIISFNNEIIESENLTIPHSQMHLRKFVLVPMFDLQIDFMHPKFNKSLKQLLDNCIDDSGINCVAEIALPLLKIDLQKYNYVAIEGNIGAGKTTLAIKIAEDFNAKTILERFADNPFLPKFYKDQSRYAFPLEMSFLADRYQQLSDDLAQFDLFSDFVVADYHIFKSLIFAKVTLHDDEFRLYKTMFDIIYKEMPKPDLYIYLYQSTNRLLENIKKRGRSYEQDIEFEYLEKINRGYLDYIKQQKDLNVLVINVSDRDFLNNQADYIFILDEIKKATL
jgi:deoxyadenosine/deoxycytidine kinase